MKMVLSFLCIGACVLAAIALVCACFGLFGCAARTDTRAEVPIKVTAPVRAKVALVNSEKRSPTSQPQTGTASGGVITGNDARPITFQANLSGSAWPLVALGAACALLAALWLRSGSRYARLCSASRQVARGVANAPVTAKDQVLASIRHHMGPAESPARNLWDQVIGYPHVPDMPRVPAPPPARAVSALGDGLPRRPRTRPRVAIVLIILAMLWPVAALATEYYVRPDGRDSGDGSTLLPWQTLRWAINSNVVAGDTVHLAAGTYTVGPTGRITWPRGRCGRAGSPIRIIGDPDGGTRIVAAGGRLNFFMRFSDNAWIEASNLTIAGFDEAISLDDNTGQNGAHDILFENLDIGPCGIPGSRNGGRCWQVRRYGDGKQAAAYNLIVRNCRFHDSGENGVFVLGGIHDVLFEDVYIWHTDDGLGADGSGDGLCINGKLGLGAPDRITLRRVRVWKTSQDAVDCTWVTGRIEGLDAREAVSCALKCWSPRAHTGDPNQGQGTFIINGVTAVGGECGFKGCGAINATIGNSTFTGGPADPGFRFKRDSMVWPAVLKVSYCWFSSYAPDPDPRTSASFAQCATPAGGPGLLTATTRPVDLRADFNGDGRVDGIDCLRWQANYLQWPAGGATKAKGDANGDGKVDGLDFLIWQAGYSPN